jgi:hypothetical protein
MLLSIAQKTYRLTLPTDGWTFNDFHFGVGPTRCANVLKNWVGQFALSDQAQGGARIKMWLPLPGDEE